MPKRPKDQKSAALDEIELHSDAWDRFENFVTAKVPNRPSAAPKRRSKASRPKAKKTAR